MKQAVRYAPLHLFLALYLALGAIGHVQLLRIMLHPGGGQECVATAGKLPPGKPRPALFQARHLPSVVKVAAALVPSVAHYPDPDLRPRIVAPADRIIPLPFDPVLLPSRPRDPPSA